MQATTAPVPRPITYDLAVAADARAARLIRCDGSTCRVLVRLPLPELRPHLFHGVLRRLVSLNRPRRILLTVLAGTPYETVVDPVVVALEQVCEAWHVPLVWLPDVRALAESLGEASPTPASCDLPMPMH